MYLLLTFPLAQRILLACPLPPSAASTYTVSSPAGPIISILLQMYYLSVLWTYLNHLNSLLCLCSLNSPHDQTSFTPTFYAVGLHFHLQLTLFIQMCLIKLAPTNHSHFWGHSASHHRLISELYWLVWSILLKFLICILYIIF